MDKFFNIICTAASVYVVYAGLVGLNRMTKSTKNFVRLAFIILTVGAMCNILLIWHPDNWQTKDAWGFELYDVLNMFWTVGVAVYVGANTRRKALLEGDLNETDPRAH